MPTSDTTDRDDVATTALSTKPGAWRRSSSAPSEPARERDEQHDERADHHQRRERLPAQEAAVRPAVDDVERALEHAEERERRPEQERAAEEAERRRVLLDRARPSARIESTDVLGNVLLQLARRRSSTRPRGPRARAARARGRAAARTRAARSRRSSPRGACRGRRRTSRRLPAARARASSIA